jgi:hypothetical protein
MIRPALALAFVITAGPALSETISRIYTPLDLKTCRHREGRGEENYGAWFCRGHAGIAVYLRGGDQRMTVSFGPRAAREPAASATLAAPNSEGKTIEWRHLVGAESKPFATILRWNTTVTQQDDSIFRGQVLVVTRLPPGAVCHVGYVDGRANPDANALAQKIADEHARKFVCGKDKPVILGQQGPGFSIPASGN